MKKLLLISLCTITLFSCKKDTAPSSINGSVNSENSTIQIKFDFKLPVDFTMFIPCTNEQVHFTGVLAGRYHISETGGGPRFHFHGNSQTHYQHMQGVGLSTGNKYTFISQRIGVANYRNSESEPFVGHVTERSRVTTSGPGNNFQMVVSVRLVRNGKGEVVISTQEQEVSCR